MNVQTYQQTQYFSCNIQEFVGFTEHFQVNTYKGTLGFLFAYEQRYIVDVL